MKDAEAPFNLEMEVEDSPLAFFVTLPSSDGLCWGWHSLLHLKFCTARQTVWKGHCG